MLAPDYQEFANWPGSAIRDNTVICAAIRQFPVEISRALRDCHAKPGRKRNFRLDQAERDAFGTILAGKQLLTPV
jgi:hypothetical protein